MSNPHLKELSDQGAGGLVGRSHGSPQSAAEGFGPAKKSPKGWKNGAFNGEISGKSWENHGMVMRRCGTILKYIIIWKGEMLKFDAFFGVQKCT